MGNFENIALKSCVFCVEKISSFFCGINFFNKMWKKFLNAPEIQVGYRFFS
jgi:hypothetical protein